jgi:hypothetical protein
MKLNLPSFQFLAFGISEAEFKFQFVHDGDPEWTIKVARKYFILEVMT